MDKEILGRNGDGSLWFGDYRLEKKAKAEDFSHEGVVYKAKSFREITKLEKDGLLLFESVPGTRVEGFVQAEGGLRFTLEGDEDAQIILGLAEEAKYNVAVDGQDVGMIQAGLGGKLSFGVELTAGQPVAVRVERA